MHLIRQSTASTVTVGPVLDSSGVAVTTAVVGDFRISKNGTTATLSGATVTHDANGYYNIALTTGNTDTAGRLVLFSGNTAQSMGAHRFTVLLPSVFDALIANATNSTGGLPTATGVINAFAGAISTLTASGVRTELATELSRIDQTISSRANQTSVDTLSSYVDTEVTAIKAKTDLIEAFPANFSLLAISGAGSINEVLELGPDALNANSLDTEIALNFWNTLTTGTFTDQSFGDRLLISTNNTRQVAVTGSNHVASVLHDAEPNSIPEDAFVTGSISARAIGTDAIDSDALASSANTEIANAVAATQALSRLDSMIESDGAGQFRFDVIALENAPAGGGGGGTDWNSNERSAIRSIFGFDSSGNISIPSLGVLDAIKDKTDLITTGTIQSSIPVTAQGQITGPLYIGDDYLSANGRAFQWTVALPPGFVIATSTCRFGMEHAEGATTGASFAVTGTVTDASGGNVTLSFSVPKATTGTLKAGFYRWSVEIASASGDEVTRVASDGKKLVEWREKQT